MSCFKRFLRCEYAKDCKLYRQDSYTCNEGDQDFCGAYKNRKYGKVESLR